MAEAPVPGGLGGGASAPSPHEARKAPQSGAPVLTTRTSSALPSLEPPRDRCFLPPFHSPSTRAPLHPPTHGMVLSISTLHVTNADFCPDDAV